MLYYLMEIFLTSNFQNYIRDLPDFYTNASIPFRSIWRSPYYVRGTKLDFYGNNWHYCMEHPSTNPISEIISSRSFSCFFVSQLFISWKGDAIVRLYTGISTVTAFNASGMWVIFYQMLQRIENQYQAKEFLIYTWSDRIIGLFYHFQHAMWQAWDFAVDISLSQLPNILERNAQYNASSFFEEQLTAFEVWLKYGGEKRPPPEQVNINR